MSEKGRVQDRVWIQLCNEHRILNEIEKNGFFEITAKDIKKIHEPRLVTKFDHRENLPKIFKEEQLSILPITRGKYIIGQFDAYKNITYDSSIKPKSIIFSSEYETINPNNITSESAALLCAYSSGMIDDIAQERTLFTATGRRSTGQFQFNIENKSNGQQCISVKNSQCEIDAGFEGKSKFLLFEAKNEKVENFIVRQLYYPYRLWENIINKEIVPIFSTYSNGIFDFFIFAFEDINDYGSIQLLKQHKFIINPESLFLSDIHDVFSKLQTFQKEPKDIPFPQADSFERVLDLLGILANDDLSQDEVTSQYSFTLRQTEYYTSACRYLGLVDKYVEEISNERKFTLTKTARNILNKSHRERKLQLIENMIKFKVFYLSLNFYFTNLKLPANSQIEQFIIDSGIDLSSSTVQRRAITVQSWLKWILNCADDLQHVLT